MTIEEKVDVILADVATIKSEQAIIKSGLANARQDIITYVSNSHSTTTGNLEISLTQVKEFLSGLIKSGNVMTERVSALKNLLRRARR
jgi:hypothetical protein